MINPWNRVMTNLSIALKDICTNISASESDLPSEFPALYVSVIDNRDYAMDLENSETGVMSFIRIQSFSNKGLNDARAVIDAACEAMRTMGYHRSLGPREIENVHDRTVKRMEARFRRFVGDVNHDIPKFPTE